MENIPFPSLEWLTILRERMNDQPTKYQKYGIANTRFVLRIEDASGEPCNVYAVEFEDYACTEVSEIAGEEDIDADFVIAGPLWAWIEMVQNITERGHADLLHTINRLSLIRTPLRAYSNTDQTRLEQLFQYSYTIQSFFDEGGGLAILPAGDVSAVGAVHG
ncbi:MAG: hypothetical protein ACYCV7_04260 [Acidimicrobiales bacterium]